MIRFLVSCIKYAELKRGMSELVDSHDEEETPMYRQLAQAFAHFHHPSDPPPPTEPTLKAVAQTTAKRKANAIESTHSSHAQEEQTFTGAPISIDPLSSLRSNAMPSSAPLSAMSDGLIVTMDDLSGPLRSKTTKEQSVSESIQAKLDRPLDETVTAGNNAKKVKKAIRCTYFPHCRAGLACEYIHPTEPCKHDPHCPFGEQCLFLHASQKTGPNANTENTTIPCRWQAACTLPKCPFLHPPNRAIPSTSTKAIHTPIPCGYGLQCTNPSCPYLHPSTTPPPASKLSATIGEEPKSNENGVSQKPSILRSKQSSGNEEGNMKKSIFASKKAALESSQTPAVPMCKFAELCQQRNCMLQHPPQRPTPEPPTGGPVPNDFLFCFFFLQSKM